jgi:hypothetical protein
LFTSLQGGALITAGGLALLHLYTKNPEFGTSKIQHVFFSEKWFLPVLLLVPTAIGLVLQNRLISDYAKWDCEV